MGKKILVDTDVLIKAYRGDKQKYHELQSFRNEIFVSVITALELLNGAKNLKQLASTKKELKSYHIIHLSNEISLRAFQLFSRYSARPEAGVGDLLIGATALQHDFQLYTDNKKHYNFIKGIKFYKEQS